MCSYVSDIVDFHHVSLPRYVVIFLITYDTGHTKSFFVSLHLNHTSYMLFASNGFL